MRGGLVETTDVNVQISRHFSDLSHRMKQKISCSEVLQPHRLSVGGV